MNLTFEQKYILQSIYKYLQCYKKRGWEPGIDNVTSVISWFLDGKTSMLKEFFANFEKYNRADYIDLLCYNDKVSAVECYFWGYCLYQGLYCDKNYDHDTSNKLFKKAHAVFSNYHENAVSHFFRGCCYYYGLGVEKNLEAAYASFKKAADEGLPMAQYVVGHYFCFGIGGIKDLNKSYYYYLGSVQGLDPLALNELGLYYEKGIVVDKNPKRAAELYALSANQGHPVAIFNLSKCYEVGFGVEKNIAKAIEGYHSLLSLGENNTKSDHAFLAHVKHANIADLAETKLAHAESATAESPLGHISSSQYKAEGSLGQIYEQHPDYQDLAKAQAFYKKASEHKEDEPKKEALNAYINCTKKINTLFFSMSMGTEEMPAPKEVKAMINVANVEGMTPLHFAVKREDWTSITLLIEQGGDIHRQNNQGLSAFSIAKQNWKSVPQRGPMREIVFPTSPKITITPSGLVHVTTDTKEIIIPKEKKPKGRRPTRHFGQKED